jgi:hypothetical protein
MSKPVAPKGETCPFNGKDVSKVCATCPLYVQVRGRDTNTGREVDHWGCSFSFLPMMLIENTGQQRQTGAAIESLRNEVVREAPRGTIRLAGQFPLLEHGE